MRILAMLPLLIVAFCIVECGVSTVPISEPKHDLDLREPLGACPSDWAPFGAHCYLVSDEDKTQPDAKQFCSEQGADLVKINGTDENKFVLGLVRKRAPSLEQVWLGLEWITNSSDFYWSDLSIPVYLNWAPEEPNGKGNEPCVNMWVSGHENDHRRPHGSWNDQVCSKLSEYPEGIVCKKLQPQGA